MADITVDTTSDEQDGSITDGDVSLRDAIALAQAGDRILFDSSIFAADLDPLTNTQIGLTLGQISIDKSLSIIGDVNGDGIADVTIEGSGNNNARMFRVEANTTGVLLQSLTFSGANVAGNGGVLYTYDGSSVGILNSTFADNQSSGYGAAILSNSTLNIANSAFTGNSGSTGAIDSSGALNIVNSTFHDNSANEGGGALYILNGTASIFNSTITGNYAGTSGGGIFNDGATLNLTNSIVAGNFATGVDNDVHSSDADPAVTSSNGANIFGSDVTGNTSGDIELGVGNGYGLTDVFQSLVTLPAGATTFKAGELADNGGPTQTVMIDRGGVARHGGENADVPTEMTLGLDVDGDGVISATAIDIDQRGLARVDAVGVDIGAVEREVTTIVVNSTSNEQDGSITDGDISLRDAIAQAGAGDRIAFDPTVFAPDVNNDPLTNTTITLSSTAINIDKDLTIDGDVNGDGIADVSIDGGGSGAGIFSIVTASTVGLSSLKFQNGSSTNGGALYVSDNDAEVSILNSTFQNNEASTAGGAIRNIGGSLTIVNSAFLNNEALLGGAIRSTTGELTIVNSTFHRNDATNGRAGGVELGSGTATITNSTFTGNYARFEGGALHVGGASVANVNNSIFAGNLSDLSGIGDVNGTISSNGANLFGTAVTGSLGSDIILSTSASGLTDVFEDVALYVTTNFDVLAGTLGDGGLTPSVPIKSDGIAVDAGLNAGLPTEMALGLDVNGDGTIDANPISIDQRDFGRTEGTAVDIGSVEVPLELVVSTSEDTDDGDYSEGDLSLREALTLIGDGGTIRFDPGVFSADLNPLTSSAPIVLTNRLLIDRPGSFTIDGDVNGDGISDVILNGTNTHQLMRIDSDVVLRSLTLQNGSAPTSYGGALYIRDGVDVVVQQSTLIGNSAGGGGAISVDGASTAASSLTLVDSLLYNSDAANRGGGIYGNPYSDITLLNSTITQNSTDGNGGAIRSFGTVSIIDSTVAGNSAVGSVGGVHLDSGNLTLNNSILVGNVHGAASSALSDSNATAEVIGSAIVGNVASVDATNAYRIYSIPNGDVSDVFETVQNVNVGAYTINTGALGSNGGPTKTISILSGGFADNTARASDRPSETDLGVDVNGDGDTADAINSDQRGFLRDFDGAPDIGAVEVAPLALVVSTAVDESDGDFSQGDLSLREAMQMIGEDGTITFDAALSGSTLRLSQGELVFNRGMTIHGGGTITITGDTDGDDVLANGLTDIDASAGNLDDNTRIFKGDNAPLSATFGIYGLTLTGGYTDETGIFGRGGAVSTNGKVAITDSTISGNATGGNSADGGGIYAYNGGTITDSTISDNRTMGTFGDGGGIFTYGGPVTVTDSTISDNIAVDDGGGIYARGILTMVSSTVSGNSTTGNSGFGGGIFNYSGAIISDSTISDNSTQGSSSRGGGLQAFTGAQISGSTISGNTTTGSGATGGGVDARYGDITVVNSSILNNHISGTNASGGGLHTQYAIEIDSSTISGNIANIFFGGAAYAGANSGGGIEVTNSIVIGNISAGTANDRDSDLNTGGTLTLSGNNIIGTTLYSGGQTSAVTAAGIFAATTDVLNINGQATGYSTGAEDPVLGGFLALKIGGDADGAGDANALPPDTQDVDDDQNTAEDLPLDQLLNPRIQGAGLDLGAVEISTMPTPGSDLITGTAGNDTLTSALAGNDTINALAGDDIIQIDPGAVGHVDLIDGGDDSDTADFTGFGAAVWVGLAFAPGGNDREAWTQDDDNVVDPSGVWRYIANLDNVENIVGTDRVDELIGDGGDNIIGYRGTLSFAGVEKIDGLLGQDTADFSRFGSAIWINQNFAGNEVWTRDSMDLDTGNWREIADIDGIENLIGTSFDDQIYAGADNNTIAGGAGDDILNGGGGTNSVVLDGVAADWTVTRAMGRWTATNGSETDTLINFSSVIFDDQTTALPNTNPIATVEDQSISLSGSPWVRLNTVLTASDADGDPLTSYEIWDDIGGNNWWADGGIVDASSGYATDDVNGIWFTRDQVASTQTLWVRAFDGVDYSAWDRFELETTAPNTAPTANVDDQTVNTGAWVQLNTVLSVNDADGDTIQLYEVWDDQGGDNWWTQTDGYVDASTGFQTADLAGIWFQGDGAPSTQSLWVRANDGEDWSSWERFELETV